MKGIDTGWMRVFVKAVRLGSFSSAAASLGMTQPAVSYQIRRVEEQAGFQLLYRHRQGVELTPKGRRLFDIVERAVDELESFQREQLAALGRPSLRLRTDFAFSSFWLMPRIDAFRSLHPEADIEVVATLGVRPEDMDETDIAMVFGERPVFGNISKLLVPEEVIPVSTQYYLDRNGLSQDGVGLAGSRLIHLDAPEPSPWLNWNRYFTALRLMRDRSAGHGDLIFNTYALVIQAALEHQGVALGWKGVVDTLLRSQTLVPAGPAVRSPERGYWLVYPLRRSSKSDRLVAWLEAETGGSTP